MSFINTSVANSIGTNIGSSSPADVAGGVNPAGGKSLSLARFEASLEKANGPDVHNLGTQAPQSIFNAQNLDSAPRTESFRVAQATNDTPTVSDAGGVGAAPDASASDRTRALRGLDLGKEAASVDQNTTGNGIIDGIAKMRGVFDGQEQAITNISGTSITNSTELINLQLEVVKYSMLMDVTSKLTGKSTQTFDTLMKGQ